MYSQCRRRVTVEKGGGHGGLLAGPQPTPEVVHDVELSYLREEAAHRLLVLLPVLDGPSPGDGRRVWGRGPGSCKGPSVGTPGWFLSHTPREGPRVEPLALRDGRGLGWQRYGCRQCVPPPSSRGSSPPWLDRRLLPEPRGTEGAMFSATTPGQGGPPGGQGPPSSPAQPLTSCSPTRSWFLAEREPEQRVGVSPYLGFQASLLGGAGKLSCLPSSRGRLASFRGPDSHLSMQGRTRAYIPLLRPEASV